MAVKFALEQLFDGVVVQFTTDSTPAENTFGWRARDRHRAGNLRVVWVPGDDKTPGRYNAGKVVAPREIGGVGVPRNLADLLELCTVYCCAADVVTPELERAQYTQARLLFDAWFRAVYTCYPGGIQIRDTAWVTETKERAYGASIRALLEVRSPMPDIPLGSPFDGTLADVDQIVGDAETLARDDVPTVIHQIPFDFKPE